MTRVSGNIRNAGVAEIGDDRSPGRNAWLRSLVGIFASPRQAFEIVRYRSPWFAPFLLLAVGAVAYAWALTPLNLHAVRAQMTATLPDRPEQVDFTMAQIEQTAEATRWLTMATGPTVLAVRLVLQTLFVWLLAIALRGRPRFVQSLSLTVHLAFVLHLKDWANLLLLHVRGPDAIRSPLDLQAPVGLDLLLAGENPILNVLYASVNPFAIWFVALLALGAAQAFEMPRRSAWLLAGVYWGAGTAFAAATTAMASRLLPT